MRTFVQKPKVTQQTTSVKSATPGRAQFGQSREVSSILNLQRTIGNQAVQQLLHKNSEVFAGNSGTAPRSRLVDDFSRIPVRSGRAANSHKAEQPEEEGPGPVSQLKDEAGPGDSGVRLFDNPPVPAPAPPVSPPSPAAPGCTITTKTLVSAPDGTADTRKEVGVNEQVEMTASTSVTWTASSGTITPATGTTAVWTTPATGATAVVTGTPAKGGPCSVSMKVLPPSASEQTKKSDRSYTAGLAGSGFIGDCTIVPTKVSFSGIQIREESVNAVATGYYDKVLGWNGLKHPQGSWITVNTNNGTGTDTVGTNPPGTSGPFSKGDFLWAIPQSFRITGVSGNGSVFSTSNHLQVMTGATGEETTSKEGVSRTRTP